MARNKKEKLGPKPPVIWAARFDRQVKDDFRALMLQMAEEGQHWFDNRRTEAHLSEIYEFIERHVNRPGSNWRWLRSEELENSIDSGSFDATDYSQAPCVILRPNERQRIVPVLVPKFVFRGDKDIAAERYPEMRLRLALFYKNANSPIRVIGYRFEAPEGPAPKDLQYGAHDYTHVQYINGFDKDDERFPGNPDLPEHTPAWPIWAPDPASMLATVWIGLYGKRAVRDCNSEVRQILERYTLEIPRSPDLAYYEISRIESKLRSSLIVMWEQQKEYVEEFLARKFKIDHKKRREIFRPINDSEARARLTDFERRYSALWKLDLPDLHS